MLEKFKRIGNTKINRSPAKTGERFPALKYISERLQKIGKNGGFTLVECVMALAVFAIMAIMVATIMQLTVVRYKQNIENEQALEDDVIDVVEDENKVESVAGGLSLTDSELKISFGTDIIDKSTTYLKDKEGNSLNIFEGFFNKIVIKQLDGALPQNGNSCKFEISAAENNAATKTIIEFTPEFTFNSFIPSPSDQFALEIALPLGTSEIRVEFGTLNNLDTSTAPLTSAKALEDIANGYSVTRKKDAVILKGNYAYFSGSQSFRIAFTMESHTSYNKYYKDAKYYFLGNSAAGDLTFEFTYNASTIEQKITIA